MLAQSDETVTVEGNHYFAADDVNVELLEPSATHTIYPWKGEASYRSLVVARERNDDATWYYPAPKDAATQIAGRVAFRKGVTVEEVA